MTDHPAAEGPAPDRAPLAFLADHPGVWLPGLYMLGSTIYVRSFASWRARNIYERAGGQVVRVRLANDALAKGPAVLLGGTIGFLFLYGRDERTVSVHPYENVLTIDSDAPR